MAPEQTSPESAEQTHLLLQPALTSPWAAPGRLPGQAYPSCQESDGTQGPSASQGGAQPLHAQASAFLPSGYKLVPVAGIKIHRLTLLTGTPVPEGLNSEPLSAEVRGGQTDSSCPWPDASPRAPGSLLGQHGKSSASPSLSVGQQPSPWNRATVLRGRVGRSGQG